MTWIIKKYFHRIGNDHWTFAAPNQETRRKRQELVSLIRMKQVAIKRHIKINSEASPYKPEWYGYFQDRHTKRIKTSIELKKNVQRLWLAQNGQCPACRLPIDEETGRTILPIQHQANGSTHQYSNLTLMHPNCHRSMHAAKRDIRKPEVTQSRYFVRA
jgi:RNA-directed DNA polymerase